MTAVQDLPDPNAKYRSFPRKLVAAGTAMYRAHNANRSAWWFDSGPHGRFNLNSPRGTCCTATRVDTAVREKVRDEINASGIITESLAATFVVSIVAAPVNHKCTAVSSSRAVRFNVVRALVTTDNYVIPQKWAKTFEDNTFSGIYYGSAYTSGGPSALALFGDEGQPGSDFTANVEMSGRDACETAGISVVKPPKFSSLTTI